MNPVNGTTTINKHSVLFQSNIKAPVKNNNYNLLNNTVTVEKNTTIDYNKLLNYITNKDVYTTKKLNISNIINNSTPVSNITNKYNLFQTTTIKPVKYDSSNQLISIVANHDHNNLYYTKKEIK
jgi:hypothetical protein